MCNADDTPRWTGRSAGQVAGRGQVRMCRDWHKLEEWARGYTACYQWAPDDIPDYPEIEHYKHCPPGSGYATPLPDPAYQVIGVDSEN